VQECVREIPLLGQGAGARLRASASIGVGVEAAARSHACVGSTGKHVLAISQLALHVLCLLESQE